MKKGLVVLLSTGILFGTSCNKEESFGEADFNGDGKTEKILGKHLSSGYALYYFSDGIYDTNFIVKGLKYSPINPSAFDFKGDGYPDVAYVTRENKDIKNYFVENEFGIFGLPKEF